MHGYFVAGCPYFNEEIGSVYVCIRKCGHELRYSVDLRIQMYTEPISLKYGKLAIKYQWIYGYFLQCKV